MDFEDEKEIVERSANRKRSAKLDFDTLVGQNAELIKNFEKRANAKNLAMEEDNFEEVRDKQGGNAASPDEKCHSDHEAPEDIDPRGVRQRARRFTITKRNLDEDSNIVPEINIKTKVSNSVLSETYQKEINIRHCAVG